MVMTNAYTLSPVPGSIVHAGGVPVLVAACASLLALAEGTTAQAATERVDEDGAEDSC